MVCEQCDGKLEKRPATEERPYHYTASGLDNVYLVGIDVYRCPACEREAPRIPRMRELHAALNHAIAMLPSRLSGPELRFLRKHRGASQKELSRRVGVEPESLSRIEHGHDKCGPALESLIRLVARDGKDECNTFDILGELADQATGEEDHNLNLVNRDQAWQVAA